MKKEQKKSKCKTCYGYGLWGIGRSCPIGEMDASDGMPTKKCPECGANPNDYFKKSKDYIKSKREKK